MILTGNLHPPHLSANLTRTILTTHHLRRCMVTMSVVLLNLLIAVLSTAHDEVYANAEKEFHLARARLIAQSARSVAGNRPPPPLNLVKVLSGVVVDTATEVYRLFLHSKRWAIADASRH